MAALTTSIPEAPGSGRNWDYRYCWMRDAFFVVRALNRIGATRTMEDFISYILSIATGRADQLRPLYGIVHTDVTGGAHRSGACRIWRRRAGADRQCGGQSGSARRLWQHHHGGDADVLRPPAAAAGRCSAVSYDRAARRAGGEARARAGCRHLGISRAKARAHAFGGDVLGRLPAACGDREPSRACPIARDLLERDCRPDRRGGAASAPGIPSARRFPRLSTATISMPARYCWPSSD